MHTHGFKSLIFLSVESKIKFAREESVTEHEFT